MISRTLGSSRKYIALRNQLGRLTDFAQALFPLLVSTADDFGRQAGDALTVKLVVFPGSHHNEADFSAALTAMHNVRLIDWYDVDGRQVIQIVQFEEHQSGLSRRTNSKFPDPPVKFTELQRNSRLARARGTERNGTELKRTELNRTEIDQNLPPPEARRDVETVENSASPEKTTISPVENVHGTQGDRVSATLRVSSVSDSTRSEDRRRGMESTQRGSPGEDGIQPAAGRSRHHQPGDDTGQLCRSEDARPATSAAERSTGESDAADPIRGPDESAGGLGSRGKVNNNTAGLRRLRAFIRSTAPA
jgi:hypothetical protein